MRSTHARTRWLERTLALVLAGFIAVDLLLIVPAYASALRLDQIHPFLPVVDLRPLNSRASGLRNNLLEKVSIAAGIIVKQPSFVTLSRLTHTIQPSEIPPEEGLGNSASPSDPATQILKDTTPVVSPSATPTRGGGVGSTDVPLPTRSPFTGSPSVTPSQAVALTATLVCTALPMTACQTSATPSPTLTAIPTSTPAPTAPPATATFVPGSQPALPIRAAFYYPWFPEAWNQEGMNPYTNYSPSLGYYDSGDETTIRKHIEAMQYGNIDAGIASWWGQGHPTNSRLPTILAATVGTSFRWSIYYEPEGRGDPDIAQITSDLNYILENYGTDGSFLRIDGRMVVFVYTTSGDSCGTAERWEKANTVDAFVVLKVFSGYRGCENQPDGWHQYAPSSDADLQAGYSYTISPGFWKVRESPRLGRDFGRWKTNILDMIASGAPFQLITSFNEWGEGTSIESADEWSNESGYGQFLEALHSNGN